MNDRWFAVGAFAGGPFDAHADLLIDRAAPDRRALFEIDAFYTDPDDPAAAELPAHLLLLHDRLDDASIERLLLPFPGRDFLSRTGHDMVNLFAPLADHQYLAAATILKRVERGTRFGQQMNLLGHLLQGDLPPSAPLDMDALFRQIAAAAAQAGFTPTVERRGEENFTTMPERLAAAMVREVVANWRSHSRGEERIVLDGARRTLTFHNRIERPFPFGRFKAVLRRPYQKFGNTEGNGLGLFLIALIAHTGGFSWDIASDGSSFSLSFWFGA